MHPDRIARKAGWLIIETGEAYEKTYHFYQWWQKKRIENEELNVHMSRSASLFIFREGRSWVLWRASYRSDQSEPVSERILGRNRDIRKLIVRGEDFITWWENKKRQPKKAAQKRKAN